MPSPDVRGFNTVRFTELSHPDFSYARAGCWEWAGVCVTDEREQSNPPHL